MFSIYGYELADAGFYINLDESKHRLTLVQNQIKKFNIKNLKRFSAFTDKWLHASCTQSHKGVFQHALNNN